jgi:hypothetical protein
MLGSMPSKEILAGQRNKEMDDKTNSYYLWHFTMKVVLVHLSKLDGGTLSPPKPLLSPLLCNRVSWVIYAKVWIFVGLGYDLRDLGPTMRVWVQQGRYFMPHDRFNNQCFLIVVIGGRLWAILDIWVCLSPIPRILIHIFFHQKTKVLTTF